MTNVYTTKYNEPTPPKKNDFRSSRDQLDQPDDNKIKSEVNCSNYCYALTTPARSKTSFSLMLVGGVDSDLASVKKTKQPGAAILQSSIT